MVAKKKRTLVVLDTNVFVRALLGKKKSGRNQQIVHLWLLQKQLHLVVCAELVEEYLDIFDRVLGLEPELIEQWRSHFEDGRRTSMIGLGKRYVAARDPDDDLLLATAHSGKAEFLVTNDKDLLELSADVKARLSFTICTPGEFLKQKS